MRISRHLERLRQASISISANCEAGIGCEPTPIKLPEIRLPIFDGTLENWHSLYDSFSTTIGRSVRLTPTQKFQYLRSAVTGKAARSIQSLYVTEANYSIAVDVLKEKFDCHRKVYMCHWDLIYDYPQILEAVEDFLETVKVNLRALEKLGEPVKSNVVLIKLFTSKFISKETKGTFYQCPRQRQHAPRRHAYITSQAPSACPTCKGSHIFKTKSLRERLPEVKRASLCINCLRKGHTARDSPPGHIGRAKKDNIRCCIGQNTTQGLVPARLFQNPLHLTVDPQHLLCHPTHRPLATEDTQRTTDRRHREQPRIQVHLPMTDEHITNDTGN